MEQSKIKSFSDLIAWQERHALVLMIYEELKFFPDEERFGLISQMQRAVISITSNIAEGFSRQSYADKIRFYYIAQWSVTELQNQIIISKDLKYINNEKFNKIIQKLICVHKLINGLIKGARIKERA
ncbi:MAG: four helix bundle protein [Candidatus Pacebacteria bacterium]|nr:four helix bundle protein [Candidatus Paceibacterota bacterium]